MAEKIKGIMFDLGDTLLDFGRVDIPSVFEAGAKLAHQYISGLGFELPSLRKYHRQQLWAIRWSYFKSHFTRKEFNSLDLLGRLSSRLGHDLTQEQTIELAWAWYRPLKNCATVETGVREMLGELHNDGLVLGIVSNTFVPGEVLDRHLADEGLLPLLPIRVYSCDVKYRKPNPVIFRIALERGALEADETIFVGDSPHADIRGAHAAGMIPVLKDPGGHYDPVSAGARYSIAKLIELREIISKCNGDGKEVARADSP
jgi:HAD superfamily hydrolase (TIGR01549 family)